MAYYNANTPTRTRFNAHLSDAYPLISAHAQPLQHNFINPLGVQGEVLEIESLTAGLDLHGGFPVQPNFQAAGALVSLVKRDPDLLDIHRIDEHERKLAVVVQQIFLARPARFGECLAVARIPWDAARRTAAAAGGPGFPRIRGCRDGGVLPGIGQGWCQFSGPVAGINTTQTDATSPFDEGKGKCLGCRQMYWG